MTKGLKAYSVVVVVFIIIANYNHSCYNIIFVFAYFLELNQNSEFCNFNINLDVIWEG